MKRKLFVRNQKESILKSKYNLTEITTVIDVLNDLIEDSSLLAHFSQDQRIALMMACGQLSRPERQERRKRKNDNRRLKRARIDQSQRDARNLTGIRSAREATVFIAPQEILAESTSAHQTEKQLINPVNCYVCKSLFTKLHFFYDLMCPDCAKFNYAKRFQSVSLKGQTALITGSRLKIGYQSSLLMLRAGARVIATTRFPVDSAQRYAKEDDFVQWKDQLHICIHSRICKSEVSALLPDH